MAFRAGDVVYWNDPKGKRSQSGVIVSNSGDQFKLLLGDGNQTTVNLNELESM